MPPPIDYQSPLQTAHHPLIPLTTAGGRSDKRLPQHLRQENRQRVIVPEARDLNGDLHPRALPRLLPGPFLALHVLVALGVLILLLLLQLPQIQRVRRQDRLFHLRLDANDGLGAVREADPRAAVGAGEDARLRRQGPELGRRAAIGADRAVGEGEGGVEVGELGGREVRGLRGGGGLLRSRRHCYRRLARSFFFFSYVRSRKRKKSNNEQGRRLSGDSLRAAPTVFSNACQDQAVMQRTRPTRVTPLRWCQVSTLPGWAIHKAIRLCRYYPGAVRLSACAASSR